MALIKCPECGKEVSDKAPACIHCGFPLNNIQPSKNENIYYNIDIAPPVLEVYLCVLIDLIIPPIKIFFNPFNFLILSIKKDDRVFNFYRLVSLVFSFI